MTQRRRVRTLVERAALVLVLVLAAATVAAPAASEPQAMAGKLGIQVELRQSGPFTLPCLGGVPDISAPPTTACVPFTGTGSLRGLGSVSLTHTELLEVGPPTCPGDFTKHLETTGRLSVARKGEIFVKFEEGARCTASWWLSEPEEFTITGGTGRFAGAFGKGTRKHSFPGGPAVDTWKGTLEVPDLTFDVTAPKLRGATSKIVRAPKGAKRVPVTYKVTANDAAEGVLPVTCNPGSGTRFRIGLTVVKCSATDSSGNTRNASFVITVKKG